MPNTGEPSSCSATQREVFLAALDLPDPEVRDAFLARIGASNPALRAAVEALLKHHAGDRFLESPAVNLAGRSDQARSAVGAAYVPAIEKPGDRIGHYRLLQEIGEGGGGVVYLAEQVAPVRRQVALKIVKPGTDTRAVIARFEQERQALALMDHPNIARVFDAGTTGTGRPFFVMELVRGIKITSFCDAESLSTPERLELFIRVCHALQHAHQKGVIHRDVKPSNILVELQDGAPVPKVIDFGIAKATGRPLTDKTLLTDFRAFMGTPAYTSPEQAEMNGSDVDTRADIYSLGVLLYELLTGATPFDPRQPATSGLDELRRTIREQEPTPPSTRLQTLRGPEAVTTARRRRSEPAHLIGLVSGDLDWIVMKCLEKDRTRRYASAAALADDVQRYLDNEPILARPPSRAYRFGKFVHRHRGSFAASAAVVAALLLGTTISTWQAFRARQAEQEQSRLRDEAENARSREFALRQLAQAQELAARRRAYAADISLIQQTLAANNFGRARRLLDAQRPLPAQEDLRGWEWRHLWQLCQSDALYTLCRQSNEVHALSASPDGRFLAVADTGGHVSVWNLSQQEPVLSLPLQPGRLPLAFSPVAPLLAFAGRDRGQPPGLRSTLRLWDANSSRITAEFPLSGPGQTLSFSTDGRHLATLTADGTITRHTIADAPQVESSRLTLLPGDARVAVISPNHAWVAFSRSGGRVVVADLATGTERWSAEAAEENLTALAFSPDGRRLATGAGYVESAIRLWDVPAGCEIARLEGHLTWVSSLKFWASGSVLVSGSADQTLARWDLRTVPADAKALTAAAPVVLRPATVLRGHQIEVWSFALFPDGHTLMSGAKDGTVLAWDTARLAGNRSRWTLPGQFRTWTFDGPRAAILTLDREGTLGRWEGPHLADFTQLGELPANAPFPRFSPTGRFLITEDQRRALQVWAATGGKLERELRGADGPLAPVTFLPQSDHLVTQRWPREEYQEWDLETGQCVRSWQLTGRTRGPFGRATAANHEWFLVLDEDGLAHLFHLPTGREKTFNLNLKQVTATTLSADGKGFAAVSRYGTGGLWEVSSGTQLASYAGVLQAMVSATFSQTGNRLAIGSDGAEAIKLWDLAGNQELLTLPGEGSRFSSCAFSADGSLLAASNGEGRLHVWHAPTWDEIARAESAVP